MPKKVISILGSTSFLAVNLIKSLKENNFIIHGYSRNDENSDVDIFHQFDYPSCIPDPSELYKSDVIIFAAGNGIQSNKKAGNLEILHFNSFYPIELMTSLSEIGYKGQFFSFGSYAEIGVGGIQRPLKEQEIIHSSNKVHNQYSVSKRLLTSFINNQSIPEYKFYHLILPTIYGPGENPKRLIPYLVDCYKKKEIARLTQGDQVRQYLHIKDTCTYIKELIENTSIESGIYNLGSPDICSVKEIVEMVQEACDKKITVEYGSARRTDTMMSYIANNDDKIKSQINIGDRITLIQGIQGYFN